MRHDPVDIVGRQIGQRQHLAHHARQIGDRVAEYLAAFHAHLADRTRRRGSAIDIEQLVMPPVGMEFRRQHTAPRRRVAVASPEHNGARAVAEQDAGRAILPVEDAAERFRPDDQRVGRRACADHAFRDRDGIKKARADRADIERDAIVDAECCLNQRRARRESLVGGCRRQHDQVDVGRHHPRCRECAAGGVGRERRGRLACARDMAKADAAPLDNPFIRSVDRLGKFGVRHPAHRQCRAGAEHRRAPHLPDTDCAVSARWPAKWSRSSVMRRVMSLATSLAATPIAFATPFTFALP